MHDGETESGARQPADLIQAAKVVHLGAHHGPGTARPPEPIGAIDERLVSLVAPNSLEAEQYRALRHVLEERRAGRAGVAVTSAPPRGGKTTTAIKLAAAPAHGPEARALPLDGGLG